MEDNEGVIPEVMKPMFETAEKNMTAAAIRDQKRAEFDAAWEAKSISIKHADEFLDLHGKTGMFLMYWDQDESSEITIQSLVCGKSKADRVMANALQLVMRSHNLC